MTIDNWDSPFDFTYKDVAIGGKLLTSTIRVPEHKMTLFRSDHELKQFLRSSMAQEMAQYMISNGLVEFTQMPDNITLDTMVKARCYLAPSDQVRILRMHYT
jgi:hypothetical protein